MKAIRAKFVIEGITPLMCNRFTDEQAQRATSGTRGSSANADRGTEREIAESKLYLNNKGQPSIPQANLMRCIVGGGSYHKIGKKQITTKESSLLYSCLCLESEVLIPIAHKAPWSVDVRPIVVPSTKGRILCCRPRFDDWKLTCELELDADIMGIKLMRQVLDDAGSREGLGDFRPARKGPFGRFKVVLWQVMEQPAALKQAAE